MSNRCLRQINGKKSDLEIAEQIRKEDPNYINKDTEHLDTLELGLSILTLDEALQKIKPGAESEIYQLTFKKDPSDERMTSKQSSSKLRSTPKNDVHLVRIRKHKVNIDGADKDIVLIREFSDQINIEKILLKQREDNEHTEFIQTEINAEFSKHCNVIDDSEKEVKGDARMEVVMKDLQLSSSHLFLLFLQFRDLMNIRSECF